jgi:hypothetical protein
VWRAHGPIFALPSTLEMCGMGASSKPADGNLF